MGLFDLNCDEQKSAPDYGAATREGIYADIETLAIRRFIQQSAAFGNKVEYTDPKTGEKKIADFTGIGDVDMSRKMLDFGIEASDKLAAAQLEQSQKYSLDYIAQRKKELEASDPEGVKIREQLGKSVLSDLESGRSLDPQVKADVVQSERAAQAARGNILGDSSAAAEAMQVGNAGFRLWQQKLANASSFLSGTTPTAQFQSLTGAQSGATPFNPQSVQSGVNINPNAAAAGWGAASDTWKMNFAAQAYNQQNNVWTKMYDTFNSMLVSAAGAGAGAAMG